MRKYGILEEEMYAFKKSNFFHFILCIFYRLKDIKQKSIEKEHAQTVVLWDIQQKNVWKNLGK